MLNTNDFNRLITAARNYYSGKTTDLTDKEYDALLLESGIKDISIYLDKVDDRETMNHPIEIPVFPKVDNWDLFDSLKFPDSIITPKWDGCSTIAYYVDGKLSNILTRSNEVNGKVKTKLLRKKFPQEVDKRVVAILGEALVPYKISASRANANGLVNSVNMQDQVDAKLQIRAFDVVTTEPMSYSDRIKLSQMHYEMLTDDEAMLINDNATYDEFYADGIVIYDNNPRCISDAHILKLHSATQTSITTIVSEAIEVSEKTGLLTPKYYLEPTVINNIKVKCVGNCGSIDTIKKKGIGIGSVVKVHLAKAIIPQIQEVYTTGELPEVRKCPKCGSIVKEFQGKFICENPYCQIWTERYNKVHGEFSEFVRPPRSDKDPDWMHHMTGLQKEYVWELGKIYKNIKESRI